MATGSIREAPSGRWQYRIDYKDADCKRKYLSGTEDTKRRAEQAVRKKLTEMDKGAFVPPSKMTVAEACAMWMSDYAEVRVRANTRQGYEGIIRRELVPAIGKVELQALTALHVRRLYAAMQKPSTRPSRRRHDGLAAGTVVHAHRLLSQILKYAVKCNCIVRNVAEGVDLPRVDTEEMRTLNASGVRGLLAAFEGSPYRALVHLAVYTGMRRSELLGLRWKDVDLDGPKPALRVVQTLLRLQDGTFKIEKPKTVRSRRVIALSPSAVDRFALTADSRR